MAGPKNSKTLTLRLSPQMYSAAQEVARHKRMSLNALMQESLAQSIRVAEEQARYDGYTLLGSDLDGSDLDFAASAQAEVMLGGEA